MTGASAKPVGARTFLLIEVGERLMLIGPTEADPCRAAANDDWLDLELF